VLGVDRLKCLIFEYLRRPGPSCESSFMPARKRLSISSKRLKKLSSDPRGAEFLRLTRSEPERMSSQRVGFISFSFESLYNTHEFAFRTQNFTFHTFHILWGQI
jgi:hypothetical protein